jgi:DNA-directed RNA polymerase specialized sigma subunit
MIKTESEYVKAVKKIEEERSRIEAEQARLAKEGVPEDLIHLAIDPLASFAMQLEEEVRFYEDIKRGVFPKVHNLSGLGRLLIALRINRGIQQKELAKKLGVSEAQVSRDERNEYRGASLEKVQDVLGALEGDLVSGMEMQIRA